MCTSFAVYSQEKTIYGMIFDAPVIDLKLKVNSCKDMNLFYFSGLLDSKYRDIAGFNGEGLFICTQAVEYNPDFKSSCDENDWFAFDIFDEALKKATEFFEFLNKRVISYPRNPMFPDLGYIHLSRIKLEMHLFWKKEIIPMYLVLFIMILLL